MYKATIGIGRLKRGYGNYAVRVLEYHGRIKVIKGRKGPRKFEVLGSLPSNPDFEELFKEWLIAIRKENDGK